jgi:hypothetical protein
VYHPTDEVRNEPLLSNVSLLFVCCCCHQEEKKKESNHIPWQDIKKKLKDITNSLSEGSLKNSERTNERTIFGWEKRRDNLCHAKVAASTENDNNYNSIRVLCIPEEEKTLSISYFSNRYIQRNAFL